MAVMVASSKKIFYFCNVKSKERHEVAARKQRFLCPNLIVINNKRNEWGSSNVPKVSALWNLTARIALSFINVKFKEYE